jgi:hypothetical protein
VAKNARLEIEQQGETVISPENAKQPGKRSEPKKLSVDGVQKTRSKSPQQIKF